MKSLIVISTPSGGKGTISDYIEKKYNFAHVSVGDLLRDEVEKNTEIGKIIKDDLSKGLLIDNNILFKLLKDKIVSLNKNYILDGTPREYKQIYFYEKLLNELDIKLEKVIFIKTDKEIAKKRMLKRYVCENCNKTYNNSDGEYCNICKRKLTRRSDDNIIIFEKRYKTFIEKTMPVIEYYKKNNLLFEINNNSDIKETLNQIDLLFRGE